MTDELKTLMPGQVLTIGGEEISVKPFKFKDLPAAAALIARYWAAFESLATADEIDSNKALEVLPSLLIDMGDDLFSLIKWCTGKDRDWSGELDIDDGIALVLACIEVNFDFFTQKIGPSLSTLTTKIQAGALRSNG